MRAPTLLLVAAVLGGCKSTIDDKPKAKVEDAKGELADTKDLPAGNATLDKANSSIGFVGAKVTEDHAGTFTDFTATLALDGDAPKALNIRVVTDSVQVEPEKLKNHLKGADFFDTATYPRAAFSSRSITAKADGASTHVIEGVLDLRGEKKDITFPATLTIDKASAKGHAEFTIDRKDFGIVYAGMADDLIKDEVLLRIDLAFTR